MSTHTHLSTDHMCYVDCDPIIVNGRTQHIMYPADEVTWTRNRYGYFNLTRREYRKTGRDETREVRLWNFHRYMSTFEPKDIRKMYRLNSLKSRMDDHLV